MSVETRAYDKPNGDPVAVIVVTGEHDVSRYVHLLGRGNCEQLGIRDRLVRQLRSHNRGVAALRLLRDHGGQDFTDQEDADPFAALRAQVAERKDTATKQARSYPLDPRAAAKWHGRAIALAEVLDLIPGAPSTDPAPEPGDAT